MKNTKRFFQRLILQTLYLTVVLYVVLLNPKRLSHVITAAPVIIPLQHTIQMIRHPSPETNQHFWLQFWGNLLGNVALFIPFGFWICQYVPVCKAQGILFATLAGLVASFIIEYCQWKFRLGVFDVDDILLNSTGALIGGVCFSLYRKYLLFHRHGKAIV